MYILKLTFTFFILFFSSPYIFGQEFKVVFAQYKPYSWESFDGEVKGLEIDILNEALKKRMEIPVSFKVLPWKRAQRFVQEGTADAFFAIPTQKRKLYTQVNEEEILKWEISIFANHNSIHIKELNKIDKIEDLILFKLGSMIGNGWSEKNLDGMDVMWVSKMEQLIKLLYTERITILPDDPLVVKYYLKELNLDNIVELKNFISHPMHLCISNKSKYLWILPQFDETIKQMKNDGTLEKIINKYN